MLWHKMVEGQIEQDGQPQKLYAYPAHGGAIWDRVICRAPLGAAKPK